MMNLEKNVQMFDSPAATPTFARGCPQESVGRRTKYVSRGWSL